LGTSFKEPVLFDLPFFDIERPYPYEAKTAQAGFMLQCTILGDFTHNVKRYEGHTQQALAFVCGTANAAGAYESA
jgi:hypothetical protein